MTSIGLLKIHAQSTCSGTAVSTCDGLVRIVNEGVNYPADAYVDASTGPNGIYIPVTGYCEYTINPAYEPLTYRLVPYYTLDKKNADGTWTLGYRPRQSTSTFSGLPVGAYRANTHSPKYSTIQCPPDVINNDGLGRKKIYNSIGQHVGFMGSSVFNVTCTNTVSVGASQASDNQWNFIDANNNNLFYPSDIVKMDTRNVKNFDRWWIALIEVGGQNRSFGKWNFGPLPAELELMKYFKTQSGSPFWNIETWDVFPVQYRVILAIANPCTPAWVANEQTFIICPSSLTGCSIAKEEAIGTISPNPAQETFQLNHVDPETLEKIHISDMNGKIVKDYANLSSNLFDVSDLQSGLYMVLLRDKKQQQLTLKLSIIK